MGRSRDTIALSVAVVVLVAAVAMCGCTALPPLRAPIAAQETSLTERALAQPASPDRALNQPGTLPDLPQQFAMPVATPQNSRAMHEVIAEIQEVGTLDPAAQQELLENLKQTDPTLWPLVAQRVRASVAWAGPFDGRNAIDPPANFYLQAPLPCPVPPADRAVPREHQAAYQPAEDEPAGQVIAVSHHSELADSWRTHLEKAIQALESELDESPRSEGELARLRMLYLLSDQREEALEPATSFPLAMQEFWSQQLSALATLTDPELTSESDGQRAQAKEHLAAAVEELGQSCPLAVQNLAFATEIELFGRYEPFEKYEFQPGQKVLLYAELENFQSRKTCRGFHTATRSSYQIFDSSGRRVAEHEFAPSEEHCPSRRRDYFIGYEFNLPTQISPGKHVLQLTVADQNSQKIGQALIEFTVKPVED